MDVEATMKMNNMVKNLTKHGIISDSAEAIKMAATMYNVEKKEEEKQQCGKETKIKEKSMSDDVKHLIDKRLQYFIEKNNEVIIKEFQNIWTRLNEINSDVDSRLSQFRDNVVLEKPDTKIPEQIDAKDEPRTRDYNEADVAIDKVFYFGQK